MWYEMRISARDWMKSKANLLLMALLLVFSLDLMAQVMRDPTRPVTKSTAGEGGGEGSELNPDEAGLSGLNGQQGFPTITLSAIVVTDNVKYAIINNEVVFEGQQWRNILLSKVNAYSVTLSLNDQIKEITINNNDFITESDDIF